jgi:colicin import membrane protein
MIGSLLRQSGRAEKKFRWPAAASRAGATRAPSSPSTPTLQPAPAEPFSRPTSANEPPKLEVDSTLKELGRAKADAQNVTASEVLAQRKLADAEAALQRTKEETERATNEAQRARADAQAARESEAAAKRKLADAEAARTAAEGRCQSAAKSQPGFGARLRKWFEPERSNPKNP